MSGVCAKRLHASRTGSKKEALRCSGFEFPPFLVLERGITFGAWAEQRRRYSEVLTMFEQIAELLHVLHASGRVHRDLKPANALYMVNTTGTRARMSVLYPTLPQLALSSSLLVRRDCTCAGQSLQQRS